MLRSSNCELGCMPHAECPYLRPHYADARCLHRCGLVCVAQQRIFTIAETDTLPSSSLQASWAHGSKFNGWHPSSSYVTWAITSPSHWSGCPVQVDCL